MRTTAIHPKLFALFCLLSSIKTVAQCPIGVAPSFVSGCVSEYYTSITAGGTGVTSTISYTGSSCVGTYFNYFATQGITAPTGSTVNINVSRSTGYLAYLAVYIDWNNNGIYETSELAGSAITLTSGTASTVYSFTIPLRGIVTNTNLNMRVFLGEPPTSGGPITSISPPCSAKWGESCDYYINATCTTPTISVSPAAPGICGASGSVTLTASGAGATPTYTWSPPSGLSATSGATVVSTPGSAFTYSVTGFGPGVCAATNTVTVTMNPLPSPVVSSGGATSVCPGGSITLAETSGTGSVFQWYNGASAIPGATNSTYTASPISTSIYSVMVTNSFGCSGYAGVTISIGTPPAASIAAGGPTTVCAPSGVLLFASPSPGYTYRWLNTGGIIAGASTAIYNATATNIYRVEVTDAAGCKDTSAGTAVTIHPAPVASAYITGPSIFCSGDSSTLNAVTTFGYTYKWLDGTTIIPGATNPTYVVKTVGTHNYRLVVTSGFGCTDTTASGLFTVTDNPTPVSAITPSGSLSFCSGGSVTLAAPWGAGYVYEWYYGTTPATATLIAGASGSSYTAFVTGYYYVTVTAPTGCSSSSSVTPVYVTVVTPPVITYNSELSFCWGGQVTLSLSGISSSTSGITYQWMLNSRDIPAATSYQYNASLTGTYTCLINVAGGACISTTPPVSISANPLPDPQVTYSGGYLQTESYYAHYQWYKGFSAIPGATTYRYATTTAAEYVVMVTDTNRCVAASTGYPLAVEEMGNTAAPVVYPNPAFNKIYIQYSRNMTVSVKTVDGREMFIRNSGNELDISTLQPGLYLVMLFDEDGNRLLTQKIEKR